MITDKETNFVYFSSKLKSEVKYHKFWNRFEKLLIKNRIPYGFIENTRDIWCRDYMPIQISANEFIQFQFFPKYYLDPEFINRLTIPSEVVIRHRISPKKSKIILDGGNLIKSKNTAIVTDKIYEDNHYLDRGSICSILKKQLKVENLFVIPRAPYEITGHADGMIRFINETDLLVADYSHESESWKKKMDRALKNTGLNIYNFPTEVVFEKNQDGDYVAKGVYINFAQIGNIIFMPQFGLNTDKVAIKRAKELFPNCKIIPVDSNEIAVDGGVLNCISWNILIETTGNFNKLPKKIPEHQEQLKFVYKNLDFYLSTSDYLLLAEGFEIAWENSTGKIMGDGDFKNSVYEFLEKEIDFNPIPQYIVDRVIDLILEYLESIGQYGFDFSEN